MVDTAEYSQQILKVARDQLEVSRQLLGSGPTMEEGYSKLRAAKEELRAANDVDASYTESKTRADGSAIHTPGSTIEYRTKTIRVVEGGFMFAGVTHDTLEKAKARIDEDGFALPPETLSTAEKVGAAVGRTLGGVTRS